MREKRRNQNGPINEKLSLYLSIHFHILLAYFTIYRYHMKASSENYARRSQESALKPIRSTVMFQGKYKEELQKTMDILEKAIEDES